MTDTELVLYKALQPHFPQDWRVGDWLYHDTQGYGVIGEIHISYGVRWLRTTFDDGKSYFGLDSENCTHLPLPIYPGDTERIAKGEQPRGLWGMVDWRRFHIAGSFDDGTVYMIDRKSKHAKVIIATPTEALLRALAAQWGVEVKE